MPKFLGVVDGSYEGSRGLDQQGGFAVSRSSRSKSFYVLADNLNQTEATIKATVGIPQLGTLYEGSMCIDQKANEHQTVVHPNTGQKTILWEVTCYFDTDVVTNSVTNINDPRALCPKRRWYAEKEEEPFLYDVSTFVPVATTAGEPIVSTRLTSNAVLALTRYEDYPWSPTNERAILDHLNASNFYGYAKGCVICDDIQVEEVVINNQMYCLVTYIFKMKYRIDADNNVIEDTWQFKPLNNGYLFLKQPQSVGDDISKLQSTKPDHNGHPVRVNLEANGTILGPTADLVLLLFKRYYYCEFNDYNLDPQCEGVNTSSTTSTTVTPAPCSSPSTSAPTTTTAAEIITTVAPTTTT